MSDELDKLKALIKGAPTGEIRWEPLRAKRSDHKPGTEEWFKESFGESHPLQMPPSFRGRKK